MFVISKVRMPRRQLIPRSFHRPFAVATNFSPAVISQCMNSIDRVCLTRNPRATRKSPAAGEWMNCVSSCTVAFNWFTPKSRAV